VIIGMCLTSNQIRHMFRLNFSVNLLPKGRTLKPNWEVTNCTARKIQKPNFSHDNCKNLARSDENARFAMELCQEKVTQ